ncbi:MAG: hypothetical protein DRI90_24880, partial [Deltaproteobacteria bacterium]
IHRDLKPDNVLVNGAGQIKLIDYGIARAEDGDLTPETRLTTEGSLVGTLQYMSPEQVGADPSDLDARTDVYSLGVVLYELLAGQLPYVVRDESILENLHAIREGRRRSLTTVCGIPADMALVVDKALALDRGRRYQSALLLKQDLANALSGAPVTARRASLAYQLRTFTRRNKALVAGSALALTGLIVGLIASMTMYVHSDRARASEARAKESARSAQHQAEAARHTAEAAQKEEAAQRGRAEAREKDAEREARIAKEVNRFLNYVLRQADPTHGRSRELTVREAVDLAAADIKGSFEDAPRVEAKIQQTVGRAYLQLGHRLQAVPHLERALSLRREHLGPDHEETGVSLGDLGAVEYHLGHLDKAERLIAEVHAMAVKRDGKESGQALRAIQNLGFIRLRLGRYEAAERTLALALEPALRVFGMEDPSIPVHLSHLAQARAELGRLDEAISMVTDAVAKLEKSVGPSHPHTLTTLNTLGSLYLSAKRYEESKDVLERVLARQERLLGSDHPEALTTSFNLGNALAGLGKTREAHDLHSRVLEQRKKKLPEGHFTLRMSRLRIAELLWDQGRTDEALALLRTAFKIAAEKHGPADPTCRDVADRLSKRYRALDKPADSAKWRARAEDSTK